MGFIFLHLYFWDISILQLGSELEEFVANKMVIYYMVKKQVSVPRLIYLQAAEFSG